MLVKAYVVLFELLFVLGIILDSVVVFDDVLVGLVEGVGRGDALGRLLLGILLFLLANPCIGHHVHVSCHWGPDVGTLHAWPH